MATQFQQPNPILDQPRACSCTNVASLNDIGQPGWGRYPPRMSPQWACMVLHQLFGCHNSKWLQGACLKQTFHVQLNTLIHIHMKVVLFWIKSDHYCRNGHTTCQHFLGYKSFPVWLGDTRNWNLHFLHAKQMLCHRAMLPPQGTKGSKRSCIKISEISHQCSEHPGWHDAECF